MQISFPYGSQHKVACERLVQAVLQAARHLDKASRHGTPLDVQVKADNTLVLNLDVESQAIILEALGKEMPIVAEEDPSSHGLIASHSEFFTVDPLDGTTSCKRFLGTYGGQVGFGPLVGYVKDFRLAATAFYSIPQRTLFTAVLNEGSHATRFDENWQVIQGPQRLQVAPCPDLSKAGMLFFVSPHGEPAIVEFLKRQNAVENVYRFGSFASDSARVAQDYEQIQFQLYAKPWDFPAVLLASEAGREVFCDPLERRVPLADWRIESNNPIVVLPAGTSPTFFTLIDQM